MTRRGRSLLAYTNCHLFVALAVEVVVNNPVVVMAETAAMIVEQAAAAGSIFAIAVPLARIVTPNLIAYQDAPVVADSSEFAYVVSLAGIVADQTTFVLF
jgi:hypothetical protein